MAGIILVTVMLDTGVDRSWEAEVGEGKVQQGRTSRIWICGMYVFWDKRWELKPLAKEQVTDRRCRRSERVLDYEVGKVHKETKESVENTIKFWREKSRARNENYIV